MSLEYVAMALKGKKSKKLLRQVQKLLGEIIYLASEKISEDEFPLKMANPEEKSISGIIAALGKMKTDIIYYGYTKKQMIEIQKKAIELLEFTTREFKIMGIGETFNNAAAMYAKFRNLYKKRQEHIYGIYLSSKNQIIKKKLLHIGTLNASVLHPRDVLAEAIKVKAAYFIIIHNHPSGDPRPSPEDLAITKKLIKAGAIIGIEMIDHIIIGKMCYYSFRQEMEHIWPVTGTS